MKDLIDELQANTREVGSATLPAGEAKVVKLSRSYPADAEDVWDALTTPERLARWFLPVSGDLRVGGTYQLEGNAGGEIRACEPPRRLQLTWIMGPPEGPEDSSIVDVVLEPDPDLGGTRLTLTHTAVVPPEMWDTFGPGAVGVGWELGVVSLAAHLEGQEIGTPADLETNPEYHAALAASSEEWGVAYRAAGVDDETVARAVAATTGFYVPSET
ncbi:MAG TPA: SRPBCC family protein [Acidimicrobiales bacterium]|jgi:uncharacterized protein YndB with AHSA1/START domain|nr:SRPBCC family protein [Acidimicrobiales bacterium]